jgi:hypothetical protein
VDPKLTSVGGSITVAPFWKIQSAQHIAVGPLLGFEVNNFGVDHGHYDDRLSGALVGAYAHARFVEGDVAALGVSVRVGGVIGLHESAKTQRQGLGVAPTAQVQLDLLIFVRD